jgi:CubicO group peptidase (beta-lactamase class C family)
MNAMLWRICTAACLVALLLQASAGGAHARSAHGTSDPPPVRPTAFDGGRVRAAALEMPRLHSLLVSWRGELVLEHYGPGIRPNRLANVKSVSKSIIAALVGVAIDWQLIPGVDAVVATWYPRLAADPDARKRHITIDHLLSMRSGLESTSSRNYGAWVRSRDWVQYVLARPLVSEPGTSMEYSTGSSHVLSAILTRATGRSTHQFAQDALGTPLGFTLARWPRDPQGIYFGGNDMLLTPRQMLAFGELYLRGGRTGDRQVLPAAWVETSCMPRGRSRYNPDQYYGYGWWTRAFANQRSCFAWGFGGQYIFVFPGLDLVVVTTSPADVSDERRGHRRMIFDLLEHHIVPQLTGSS